MRHHQLVSTWVVSVYSTTTDELIVEHEVRSPDRTLVRKEWGLHVSDPIGELLITDERLAFVDALLDAPLQLNDDEEAYLGEYADYPDEVVEE